MNNPLNLQISAPGTRKIDCNLFLPEKLNKVSIRYPLIIFAHGFKGFKDWGGFPYLCTKIAQNGFAVLGFNFSHNGVGHTHPMDFTELELFAENTHTIELQDYDAVLNFVPELAEKYPVDTNKIGLLGHSRGGGLSIIAASENSDSVKALVTLASVADFDRYTDEQKRRWRQNGFIEMPNTRTNQLMKMNISLLDDIETNRMRLSITNAASALKIPFLIIHGREDLAVKCSDAEKIYNSTDKNLTELVIVDKTGHTFGMEHPFKGTNKVYEDVIEMTSSFFKKNLH